MVRKAVPVRQRISAAGSSSGFTLIESLVALAILGVIVGVLVRVHLQTLRADEFSRLRGGAVFECETIFTETLLGREPHAILEEAGQQGWKVSAEPAGEAGKTQYTEWRVAVSNPSAPSVTMVLRPPAPAKQSGKPGDEGKKPGEKKGI